MDPVNGNVPEERKKVVVITDNCLELYQGIWVSGITLFAPLRGSDVYGPRHTYELYTIRVISQTRFRFGLFFFREPYWTW